MKTATSYIRLTVALAVAAVVLVPRSVRAQSAEAEALFQEGKRLMDKGQTAQACDKFEASERIEPASGTELNLASCRQKNGQLASAWAAYIKTATTAKHNGNARRAAEARKKAAELEPQLIHLTITVAHDVRVDGLVIKRNNTAVDEATWNQRLPVDPDEYTISAEAPGYKPWSTTVVVKTKDQEVEVPALEPRPVAKRVKAPRTAEPSDGEATAARDRAAGAEASPAPSRWTGTRKLSLVVAAVGVAAAGAGIGLGIHANTLEHRSGCSATTCDTTQGVTLNQSAQHYALAADIGFATAGVAVVGAAALWLLGAPSSRDTVAIVPTLDATHVGISFARSF